MKKNAWTPPKNKMRKTPLPPPVRLRDGRWYKVRPTSTPLHDLDPDNPRARDRGVRYGIAADVPYLLHLQNKHKHAVGYAPNGALIDRVQTNRIIVLLENDVPAGYLNFTHRLDGITHVSQVAIDDGVWRTRAGTLIMRTLIDSALDGASVAITLKSALDLEANFFWPTLGFLPNGIVQGHRRPLSTWCKPLHVHPLALPDAPTAPKCPYIDRTPPPTH